MTCSRAQHSAYGEHQTSDPLIPSLTICFDTCTYDIVDGAQWLTGRVLDLRPRGCGFEPHRRHCLVVLEQDTFFLA